MASWERLHWNRRNWNRVEVPFADIREMTGDRGGGGHHGAHQVRATAAALAPFEVAVAGGRTALAGSENIRIHAQAHGAAGLTPLETGGAEDLIQSLLLGLPFDLLRA